MSSARPGDQQHPSGPNTPSGPYPPGPPSAGPSTAPQSVAPPDGGQRPPAGPRRAGRLATGAALAAVVVAVLALGVAVAAYGRAGDTRTVAAGPALTVTATPPGTAASSSPDSSTDPSTDASSTDPSTEPTAAPTSAGDNDPIPIPKQEPRIAYTDHRIQLQAACGGAHTVDVDEPRVDADNYDFRYSTCTAGGQFDFGTGVKVAQVGSPTASALDCLGQIQDAPLNNQVVPAAGHTLCVVTSAVDAQRLNITRKVVRLAIRGIDDDRTVTALLTAWDLPR
jgi:hypothetical protein